LLEPDDHQAALAVLYTGGLDWSVEDSVVLDVSVVDQDDTAVVQFERVVQLVKVVVQQVRVVVQYETDVV